jgi:hypothetical protein
MIKSMLDKLRLVMVLKEDLKNILENLVFILAR